MNLESVFDFSTNWEGRFINYGTEGITIDRPRLRNGSKGKEWETAIVNTQQKTITLVASNGQKCELFISEESAKEFWDDDTLYTYYK